MFEFLGAASQTILGAVALTMAGKIVKKARRRVPTYTIPIINTAIAALATKIVPGIEPGDALAMVGLSTAAHSGGRIVQGATRRVRPSFMSFVSSKRKASKKG
jgi:hypothetical protein